MDAGRPDLNSLVKVSSIPVDEPVFLLRGQDPNAAAAVRAWAAFAAMAGVSPAMLESALVQADRMELWRVKKLPADDFLTEPQRLQLEYQHRRREWAAAEQTPWRLAQARSYQLDDPAALLRQLAREQHRVAAGLAGSAAQFLEELAAPGIEQEQSAAWVDNRRRAADDYANRAAYFLTVATALQGAAEALAAPGVTSRLQLAVQP
jgi:hypothetical protein